MEVFHGSTVIVDRPLILSSARTLDYGAGFYTTTSYEQALNWVRRKLNVRTSQGYVNCYEVNIDKVRAELKTLWFELPDEAWLDFVEANRTNRTFHHDYDIVFGPVANDKVYTAFALYEDGIYGKEELIRELKTYTLVDQLLFHTERSLSYLTFKGAEEVI